MENQVMRSIYLNLSDDMVLRQLAHTHGVTKSDLLRAAVAKQVDAWKDAPSEQIKNDITSAASRTPKAHRTRVPRT